MNPETKNAVKNWIAAVSSYLCINGTEARQLNLERLGNAVFRALDAEPEPQKIEQLELGQKAHGDHLTSTKEEK